jgi:hypothetical protein
MTSLTHYREEKQVRLEAPFRLRQFLSDSWLTDSLIFASFTCISQRQPLNRPARPLQKLASLGGIFSHAFTDIDWSSEPV